MNDSLGFVGRFCEAQLKFLEPEESQSRSTQRATAIKIKTKVSASRKMSVGKTNVDANLDQPLSQSKGVVSAEEPFPGLAARLRGDAAAATEAVLDEFDDASVDSSDQESSEEMTCHQPVQR